MNISWVLADTATADPTMDVAEFKRIGALWGSWRTWRAFQTDNVVCHDQRKTDELIRRNFQNTCNFYIPNSVYLSLNRPDNVRLYEGAFVHDVDRQEEIVSLHLASSQSDIVLLLGFDFTEPTKLEDRLLEHRACHYRSLAKQVIKDNTQAQWVLIDHPDKVMENWSTLDNLTCDTLSNVLTLLN
jgi:hypothetical protein